MSKFVPQKGIILGAALIATATLLGCPMPLDDGHYGCARGPCPSSFYCHSDALCYATPEADASAGVDALLADAFLVDAPSDARGDASTASLDVGTDTPTYVDAVGSDGGGDTPDAFSADAFGADAFGADAFTADAFVPDAFSGDAFVRPDARRDAGRDAGTDATLPRGFFTPCMSNAACSSGLCYFPNGEPYTTGYCTPMCTSPSTCPASATACQSNGCVVTCSASMLCPASSRCALSDRNAGECLAPGVAPLPIAATACGGPTRCAIGVCDSGVCRRACLNSTGCPDTQRCLASVCIP